MEAGIHGHLPIDNHRKKNRESFLDTVLDRVGEMCQHLDHQTNILIGISAASFLFSASKIDHGTVDPAFIIIAIASGLSTLTGLLAIHPPRFMRKQGQTESLAYNKVIAHFPDAAAYEKALREATKTEEEIFHQCATEIYNLSRFYYRPKKILFHYARTILFVGIALAILSFSLDLPSYL
jgi:hypothetical protein